MWTRGVQGLHSPGVHEGVQKCGFLGGSRWARKSVVAACQFRPATIVKSRDIPIGCLETSLCLGSVAVALGHAAFAECSGVKGLQSDGSPSGTRHGTRLRGMGWPLVRISTRRSLVSPVPLSVPAPQ